MLHGRRLLYRRRGVSRRGAPQDLGRQAATLGAQSFEEIVGADLSIAGALLRQGEDFADARRHEDSLPYSVLTRTERSANLGVHLAHVDALRFERAQNRAVALFEERDQQVFGADVVVAMVAALLFGYPKDAPRGWI
jgi:hypothetical protein